MEGLSADSKNGLSPEQLRNAAWFLQILGLVFVCILIAMVRRLFSRTAEADEFLDSAMTTPGDYTLEVRLVDDTLCAIFYQ